MQWQFGRLLYFRTSKKLECLTHWGSSTSRRECPDQSAAFSLGTFCLHEEVLISLKLYLCIFQNDLTVSEPLLLFWELSTVCCWSVASKVSFLVAIIYLLTWLFVIKLLRLWPLFSLVQGVIFMYISAMKLYFVFSRMTSLSVSLFYSFVNYPQSASGGWLPKLRFWLP